jgi:hypothetical protein
MSRGGSAFSGIGSALRHRSRLASAPTMAAGVQSVVWGSLAVLFTKGADGTGYNTEFING